MAAINSIGKRLEFIKISEETRATLREMRPLIARVLPGILDEFYRHVAGHAEVARLFPDQAHMQHAKAMQLKHWDMIASATFDEGYVTSVTRIGEAHNRLGLEPRWYIGGYAILMAGLARAIECETQAGFLGGGAALQEKKAKMLQAMISAALLDMDFAISVYLESGLRAKQETLDRLGASFRGVIETVSQSARELEATAGTLRQTAETTQHVSTTVASASAQTSGNVQAVAAAAEELGASIREISGQVQESSAIAHDAVGQAERTNTCIGDLSQAAGRIGDVVKLISEIAAQTNLLALNATIEAARAGDAGKGFAVVAQEVKALAAQTAKATDEIGRQITGMQAATGEAVNAVKEIGATIARISQIATAIAAAVEEQGAATQDIAASVHQAAAGSAQVATNIADVSRGATDTASAASQLLAAATAIGQQSTRLTEEVDHFLKTVRAA
jgi:methyl-accepting chemotaxis protein